MGNYNQVFYTDFYTDFRWIKELPESKIKTSEKNIKEKQQIYIPLPLSLSYNLEQKLFILQKKKIESDENFDLINNIYKEKDQIFYRIKYPINDKIIYRKKRLNRNPFKPIASKRTNTLNELKIFFFENIFQDFDIDIDDPFIVKFCHHVSLLHIKIINIFFN